MSRDKIKARIPERWGKYCDVGDGWMPIVSKLDDDLAALDPDYTIAQVKEKFGGLRYYLGTIDPAVAARANELIREAENKCDTTCEVCGQPGTLRETGWLKTKCDDCFVAGRQVTYGQAEM